MKTGHVIIEARDENSNDQWDSDLVGNESLPIAIAMDEIERLRERAEDDPEPDEDGYVATDDGESWFGFEFRMVGLNGCCWSRIIDDEDGYDVCLYVVEELHSDGLSVDDPDAKALIDSVEWSGIWPEAVIVDGVTVFNGEITEGDNGKNKEK